MKIPSYQGGLPKRVWSSLVRRATVNKSHSGSTKVGCCCALQKAKEALWAQGHWSCDLGNTYLVFVSKILQPLAYPESQVQEGLLYQSSHLHLNQACDYVWWVEHLESYGEVGSLLLPCPVHQFQSEPGIRELIGMRIIQIYFRAKVL